MCEGEASCWPPGARADGRMGGKGGRAGAGARGAGAEAEQARLTAARPSPLPSPPPPPLFLSLPLLTLHGWVPDQPGAARPARGDREKERDRWMAGGEGPTGPTPQGGAGPVGRPTHAPPPTHPPTHPPTPLAFFCTHPSHQPLFSTRHPADALPSSGHVARAPYPPTHCTLRHPWPGPCGRMRAPCHPPPKRIQK